MDILTNFTSPVHFDCFSLELGQLKFNGSTRVGGRDLELQFELISHIVMSVRAGSLPLDAIR